MPSGSSLSSRLPTVGQEPLPEVVSDSPHFIDRWSWSMPHSSRRRSDAHTKYSWAVREAAAMVARSPCSSIANPATGLPVAAMPSTTRAVQPGSMPITTQAATLGLRPVPMMVRKYSSRSAPNCSRP